jgi:hypothetical protein
MSGNGLHVESSGKYLSHLAMMYLTSFGSMPKERTSSTGVFVPGIKLNIFCCFAMILGGYSVGSLGEERSGQLVLIVSFNGVKVTSYRGNSEIKPQICIRRLMLNHESYI